MSIELTMAEHLLDRIAGALERMAAADERRNELLVMEFEARQKAWDAEQEVMGERWRAIQEEAGREAAAPR